MQKGYSKEMMEALFKQEEQKKEQEEKLHKKASGSDKQEYMQLHLDKMQEQIDKLVKQVKNLRIALIVSSLLALIALAMSFNEAVKEFLLLLP